MLGSWFPLLLLLSCARAASSDPFKPHTISAPGIKATFIGYGARLTHLYVPDKNGIPRDVVVGFDNPKDYLKDTSYLGPIVGRYANRIKNGTFTIDGKSSKIVKNEHGGLNPLHGGLTGYDKRNWNVVSANQTSITFSLLDLEYEGFPGNVITYATYSVSKNRLTANIVSIPLDEPTPIMIAHHIYWNLDAFTTGPKKNILDNVLHMPYSKRTIEVDNILIPTGSIRAVAGTPLDFTSPKKIGKDISKAHACGFNCTGYDNAFILDRPRHSGPESLDQVVLSLSSPFTGIKLDIRTNQQGLQIYSCVGQNGTIVPAKQSQQHGGKTKTWVEQSGCLVIETQDWIDGINHPEWGRDIYQIYSPFTGPAVHLAVYDFSIVDEPKAAGKQKLFM